jgi:hypothetical protein
MSDNFLSASEASNLVSINKVVLKEINLIQEKILDAVQNCANGNDADYCISGTYCTVVAGDTPMTFFGSLASAIVTNAGQDYQPVVATVEFDGPGTGATADLTINATGSITEVTLTAGGTGYTSGGLADATIVIVHPSGIEFDATVQVDLSTGEITGVTIISSGSGYVPLLPTIALSNAGNGAGAVLTLAVDDTNGSITGVTIDNVGHSYQSTTTATVVPAETSGGADATVLVTFTTNPIPGVDPLNYYLYLSDQAAACPVEKDIQSVITYFRKKGYSITAQINSTTNTTIQWKICWC